jgi:hypothetical protein
MNKRIITFIIGITITGNSLLLSMHYSNEPGEHVRWQTIQGRIRTSQARQHSQLIPSQVAQETRRQALEKPTRFTENLSNQ